MKTITAIILASIADAQSFLEDHENDYYAYYEDDDLTAEFAFFNA